LSPVSFLLFPTDSERKESIISHIHYPPEDQLATVMLDNPPQNRLSREMVDDLAYVVENVRKSNARALLLRAPGPAFCSGADITWWPDVSTHELRAIAEHLLSIVNQFESLPIPTVAAVQGLCGGGGLTLCTDLPAAQGPVACSANMVTPQRPRTIKDTVTPPAKG
jgi:enoyl-CoA hydratase/carnithine racemase